jgi:predicted Zn-ribbon and HTH transcriptional regulator
MHKFFEKIGVWLKQLKAVPANLAKIADIDKNLEIKKELSETQKRLEKAEKRLAKDAAIKAGRMFFCNNVFWIQDENGDIEGSPYCPHCFELDGKAVHLIVWQNGSGDNIAKCLECKSDEILFRMPE